MTRPAMALGVATALVLGLGVMLFVLVRQDDKAPVTPPAPVASPTTPATAPPPAIAPEAPEVAPEPPRPTTTVEVHRGSASTVEIAPAPDPGVEPAAKTPVSATVTPTGAGEKISPERRAELVKEHQNRRLTHGVFNVPRGKGTPLPPPPDPAPAPDPTPAP